jgi:predicted dehydrogenase
MADFVRMGVVGAGTIALRGILPHLSQQDVQDRVRLQTICDPFPGRAAAAANKFGIPQFFEGFERMLESADIDAVTIASPINLHFQQGKQALLVGKHVHFNKSMTTTSAEATELIELAKQNNLNIVASPGEVLRPQVQRVRELIKEGAIGQLCWATCGAAFGTYHQDEEFRQGSDVLSNLDPSWYFRKPGGGPVYDMTVYALHGLTSVLGPAKRVTAMSGTRIKERSFKGQAVVTDADDNTLVLIDFGNNLFALAYGTAAGSINHGFAGSYFGTTGNIQGYTLNGQPFEFPGKEEADKATDWRGMQWVLPHVVGPHRMIDEQHVFEDIMQLVDWARDGKPSPVTAEHARHVIEIIEMAYQAAETGQTQSLTTTFTPVEN